MESKNDAEPRQVSGTFRVSVSETMAARGLVNGRGPQRNKTPRKIGTCSYLSGWLVVVWEG